MARFGIRKRSPGGGSIRESSTDAIQLVIDYLKQETLSPLKGLGRFLLFGITGSIMLCGGLVLLLIALLRALQTDTTGTFNGSLDWLPYVIVWVGAVIMVGFFGWRITKGASRRAGRRSSERR